MQPKLPLKTTHLLYECANPKCFYVGSLMTSDDVLWKHFWNSDLQDLDLRGTCPSCGDPLMIWDEGCENGTLPT